ncbi:MAG: tetratricopeptide repeat protein [Beijerinckiaceae bacterium]
MSDIFNEVDEEFRRSKAEAAWSKYGGFVIAACAVLVLSVAGYRYFEWQREKAAAEAGAKFESAFQLIQTGKTAEGEAAIAKIAGESNGIYKVLAQFRMAGDLGKKDAPAAIKAFDALAADAALNQPLRDMARLRAGALAVDSLPLADVEQRLAPLASPTSNWRHTTNELLAAAALKAGNVEKARTHLDTIIIDRDAPPAIKSRAELLIGLTRGAK